MKHSITAQLLRPITGLVLLSLFVFAGLVLSAADGASY
jgi:hypothetical protein